MKNNIEQFIDKNGLIALLEVIQDVCMDKAAHIEESYSDKQLVEKWDKATQRIIKAQKEIGKLGIG